MLKICQAVEEQKLYSYILKIPERVLQGKWICVYFDNTMSISPWHSTCWAKCLIFGCVWLRCFISAYKIPLELF